MERIKIRTDNYPQYQIDRPMFASELRHFGVDVDLEDWDGLDDKQLTHLVLTNNIERSQMILMIKRDCKEPKGVNDEV